MSWFVCLDFDGTLVDSEPLHYQAWVQALSAHGRTLSEAEYFRRFVGLGTLSTAATLAAELALPLPPAELAAAKGGHLTTLLATELPVKQAGADALLAGLQALGVRLALVTGAYRREVEPVLVAFGWRAHFAVVITRDEVREPKPHPEPYLRAVQALGLGIGQGYAVEDSSTGLQSALQAGLPSLLVGAVPSGQGELHRFDGLVDLMTWFRLQQQAD